MVAHILRHHTLVKPAMCKNMSVAQAQVTRREYSTSVLEMPVHLDHSFSFGLAGFVRRSQREWRSLRKTARYQRSDDLNGMTGELSLRNVGDERSRELTKERFESDKSWHRVGYPIWDRTNLKFDDALTS